MILVSTGVILFVMLPVLRGDWAAMERSDAEVTEVDARKQAALRGLRDAEYDLRSGKIDQEDYQVIKSDLARQALEAMGEESAGDHAAEKGLPRTRPRSRRRVPPRRVPRVVPTITIPWKLRSSVCGRGWRRA